MPLTETQSNNRIDLNTPSIGPLQNAHPESLTISGGQGICLEDALLTGVSTH